MGKEILTFGDIEIKKKKNLTPQKSCFLNDVDIGKVLVSNKISFGEAKYKYFIGYLYDNGKVKSSHIMVLKASTYVKIYDGQIKRTYFLIEDDDLLERYNTIGAKSLLISRKNLMTSLSIIKIF